MFMFCQSSLNCQIRTENGCVDAVSGILNVWTLRVFHGNLIRVKWHFTDYMNALETKVKFQYCVEL